MVIPGYKSPKQNYKGKVYKLINKLDGITLENFSKTLKVSLTHLIFIILSCNFNRKYRAEIGMMAIESCK